MSLHRNRGAKRAREARAELGLDPVAPLPCLLDVVEDAGFPVIVAPLAEGVAGACTSGPLLWVNGTQAPVRQRFTLAHELGHAWSKHDGHLAVDTYATLSGRSTNEHEVQANAFAAEFLVPRAAVEELAREPSLDELVVIAAHYGTSATMTLYRFKQFGLASDALRAEAEAAIAANEHHAAHDRLRLTPLADRLGTLDRLPYLSPPLRDSRLGAALDGDAEADPALARAIARLLGG